MYFSLSLSLSDSHVCVCYLLHLSFYLFLMFYLQLFLSIGQLHGLTALRLHNLTKYDFFSLRCLSPLTSLYVLRLPANSPPPGNYLRLLPTSLRSLTSTFKMTCEEDVAFLRNLSRLELLDLLNVGSEPVMPFKNALIQMLNALSRLRYLRLSDENGPLFQENVPLFQENVPLPSKALAPLLQRGCVLEGSM
jgi:hypothetical protein